MTSREAVETASFNIVVNGSALDKKWLPGLLGLRVEEELNLPGMFAFEIDIVDFESNDWTGVDLKTFYPGAAISIFMGEAKAIKLISGTITGLEPHFGSSSTMIVRGYDKLYNLHFGIHQRVFEEVSDSQVAEQLISESGLAPDVESSSIIWPFLMQNNCSNFDYLSERARLLDYELRADGDTISFKKTAEGESAELNLTMDKDVQELDLNLSVLTRGGDVTVETWDPSRKQITKGVADSANSKARMGGRSAGFAYSEAFPATQVLDTGINVPDAAAATTIAKSLYAESLDGFIQGEGQALGNSNLRVGKNIEIQNLGPRFSGLYYVIGTVHRWTPSGGYHTDFRVRRTGI